MAYFRWKPRFITGIRSVDFEHVCLVDLLNEMSRRTHQGCDHRVIASILGEFHALASAHFALEECIMARAGHPDYRERRRAHRSALENVREIMDAAAAGRTPAADVPAQLYEWLQDLMEMDARLFASVFTGPFGDALKSRGTRRAEPFLRNCRRERLQFAMTRAGAA